MIILSITWLFGTRIVKYIYIQWVTLGFYFLFCIFVSFVFNWLISFWVSFDCLVAVFYFARLILFWFLVCVCVCVCVCACVCTHTHAYTCLYFLCSSVFLDFALTFVWVSFLSLLLPWWMACGVLIPWLEVWPEPLGSKHWVQDTEQRIPGPRDYWSVRAPIKASVQIQDLVPPNCL